VQRLLRPETEGALIWNDPEIGIEWPVTPDLTISDKDKSTKLLAEFESPFVFGVNS
jgi:dTDP-4-dehydrorhamnose 3,5-epimerase